MEAGRLIWENRGERLSGSGHRASRPRSWRTGGLRDGFRGAGGFSRIAGSRIVCVSGSVSPITAAQIAFAVEQGFAPISIDATQAIDRAAWEGECARAVERALAALGQGRDPLVYSAAGPDDPAVAGAANGGRGRGGCGRNGERPDRGRARQDPRRCTAGSKLTRAVISGGDSSSHAASVLGIDALTAVAPIAPGSPLCRAHATILRFRPRDRSQGRPGWTTGFLRAVKRGGTN